MPHLTVKKKVPGLMLNPGEVIVVGPGAAAQLLRKFKRYLVESVPGDDELVPDWGPQITNEERAAIKMKTWPLPPEERRKFKKPEPGKGPTVENRSARPDHHR